MTQGLFKQWKNLQEIRESRKAVLGEHFFLCVCVLQSTPARDNSNPSRETEKSSSLLSGSSIELSGAPSK